MYLGRIPNTVRKAQPPRAIGRYLMYDEIASGGMAAVHLGRFSADAGFSRIVAMKYLHPNYARDGEFISMFLDEARLVSRIRHPNVASPLDVVVVAESQEIFLVMEYIHGASLAWLLDEAQAMNITVPPNICASIMSGALHGLHAAHEAVDETGSPLNIVHRDFSPQNIMVGADGASRVLDFGVAKAVSRAQSTRQGQVKGKVSYMAPEQLTNKPVDRRADIFAAGIVLWEALTMGRLFTADDPVGIISKVLQSDIPRPSSINGNVSQALDRVVMKALQRNPAARYRTAREFAEAIEEDALVATTRKVGEWVSVVARRNLAEKAERVRRVENDAADAMALQEAQQSVKSMLTISQTIAILRECDSGNLDKLSDEDAASADPDSLKADTNASHPAVRGKRGNENTPTKVLSAPTPPPTTAFGESTSLTPSRVWRYRKLAVTGLVAAVVALVGLTVIKRPGATPAVDHGQAPVSKAVTATVSPIDQHAGASDPAASARGESTPSAGTAAHPKLKRPATKAVKASRADAAKRDCVPPFFIDDKGIRRIKPQCL